MAVELVGVDKLSRKLDTMAKADSIKSTMGKAVGIVLADAKSNAPVDTGNLKGSIHGEVKQDDNDTIGRVFTATEYAPYVEFGTGVRGASSGHPAASKLGLKYGKRAGQVAQPYLHPALKRNESHIKKLFADSAQKLVKGS